MAIVITGASITAPDGAIDAADLTGTLPALNGAALTGVGGATSLITDWTDITVGAATLTINFTDDNDVYFIELEDVEYDGSATGNYLYGRFTDSSDNVLSVSPSYYRFQVDNRGTSESSVAFSLTSAIRGQSLSTPGTAYGTIEIRNPKSSTAYTKYFSSGFNVQNDDIESPFNFFGQPMGAPAVNNGVVFFNSSVGGNFSSGRYRVYGVKL